MAEKRSSILCPNCRRLVSIDETRCPWCGISNPGSVWRNNIFSRAVNHPDQVVRWIIGANIGMYLISLLINPMIPRFGFNPILFLSPENKSLLLLGATGTIPTFHLERWWTLVSASYLHGSILHIFFNMFAFKQIAPFVIQEFGVHRMFIIYSAAGIFGFLISCLAGITFTIGASAALCGLIGASLYYGKSRGGLYGQSIYRQLGGWTIGMFIFGFIFPGINNWGHGGGLIAGIALGFLLGYREQRPESLTHQRIAAGFTMVTALILGYAVATTLYYRLLS
ncbi:MAG: rhomboid family intramembrane serine protease [Thermodesulfobacteriota bacterium]